MNVYVFVGDRGEILGREPLRRGDRLELTDADAQYLVIDQAFPLIPLAEFEKRAAPAENRAEPEEMKENVTV